MRRVMIVLGCVLVYMGTVFGGVYIQEKLRQNAGQPKVPLSCWPEKADWRRT
jgi:uncharacterized protein YneF (UPF0154 family)